MLSLPMCAAGVTARGPLSGSGLSLPLDTSLLIKLLLAPFLYYAAGKILSRKDLEGSFPKINALLGFLNRSYSQIKMFLAMLLFKKCVLTFQETPLTE